MKFAELTKELNGIKYEVVSEGTINLPFDTKVETVNKLIGICREKLMVDWHIVYNQPNELNATPPITVWWDRYMSKK